MLIEIRETPFDPLAELSRYQAKPDLHGKAGALASFIGLMRDHNEGDQVSAMCLEHYPGMTEREIARIIDEAQVRWPLLDALVLHRVGEMLPADPIVLVAVWSSHRAAAFESCRYIMEALKSRAPFWKHETLTDRGRWVDRNTDGY
ncbi:molybdenum cofactor biosynthesis protein MoaE [Plasticicumulans acidivorans]|uniref:Molybdopterin synthase catalytic subunit n=1 Tax=Plasticicumulans acidivorans TaxID=886464 RepID=A0A317MU91_9GAMM|nr:molybdenum cofactor biosynthesis protein MoaE [Plasticicumulans acidivorans]PWV60685.1 molybdopterin synthase subunit MoaE [Plasticicumulans acidivorans]